MRRVAIPLIAMLCVSGAIAQADTVIARSMMRPGEIILSAHVELTTDEVDGALSETAQAIGQEVRRVLYPGRPITQADIGPPALVERNQSVSLHYRSGSLSITTEARALERGGAGEIIRVINTASHVTLSALIGIDGTLTAMK